MKAIKYLVAGVMMLSISAPTMAQTDKAQFDAIAKTIVDKNGDANALKDDIKAFTKLYKKNPEAMANIGRAFLEVDNYEKANEYADLAIKVIKIGRRLVGKRSQLNLGVSTFISLPDFLLLFCFR